MKSLKINTLCILMISGLFLQAQNNKTSINQILTESVNQMANRFLEDSLMKSLSIGVYYKGEEFIKHYGELDKGKGNAPTNSTIYDIGSVTKTMVGTLMAKAELEGRLSMEDDIRDYMDGEYPNLQYQDQPITIRHLITHTSGLPKFLPLSIMDEFSNISEDIADRLAKILDGYTKQQYFEDLKMIVIDTMPGVTYTYTNAGVELAAYILEKAYGKPFESVLKEELGNKANMPSTSISLTSAQKQEYANGYGDYNNPTPQMNTTLWGGSGYGKSTMIDLMNYMKYHMSDEPEVLRSHKVLFDKEPIHGDPKNKLGYMWEVNTDGDFGKYIKHHGGAFGVQNWMMVYPEEQMGISIITNQSGMRTAGKLLRVAEGILNEIAKVKNASDKTETEQITETLMDYIEGSTGGQPDRLKKAFHPDLNLYYNWAREFRVWSGKSYIADTKEGQPTGEIGEILSIDYENDIATAKIRISDPENPVPYIDYLMLTKINGHWTIIHKMFTKEVVK